MTKKQIQLAIEYLTKMMPEWDYDANVHCPDSYHGLGELICNEPEGYVYKIAIEALEKADKYRWHDLKEDPTDLPKDGFNKCLVSIDFFGNELYAVCTYEDGEFLDGVNPPSTFNKLIKAWREIEPFERG